MYQVTTLGNGLKVISKELKTVKTIFLQVHVGAGSKFVPKGKEGLAHFLEHMIMNGNSNYPSPLLVRRAIEELGGTINGATGVENATYWIKVTAEDLEKAAGVLLPLVTNPLLDEREFASEKKIALEEIAEYEDKITNLVSDNFYDLIFGEHPLGKRVLGYRKTVKDLSMSDVSTFFGGYYLPKNTTVCAVGSTKHSKIVDLIQKYFPSAPPKEIPKYEGFHNKPGGPKAVVLKKAANQAYLILSFVTYPEVFKDYILGRFVCRLLNSKDRLFARLREKERLTYSVGATYNTYQDISLPSVSGGFSYRNVDKAARVLTEELQVLKKGKLEEKELAKIRKLIEVDFLFALETPSGWANFALFTNDLLGHPIEPEEYLEEVAKVKAGDIRKFAKETFIPERAYLSTIHESVTPKELEDILRDGLHD